MSDVGAIERVVEATAHALRDTLRAIEILPPGCWQGGFDHFTDFIDLTTLFEWVRPCAFSRAGKVLGLGANRVVYAWGEGVALKVALHPSGRRCNLAEAATWRHARRRLRGVLMPVLDVAEDGSWLTMRRSAERPTRAAIDAARRVLPRDLAWDAEGARQWGAWPDASTPRLLDYAPDPDGPVPRRANGRTRAFTSTSRGPFAAAVDALPFGKKLPTARYVHVSLYPRLPHVVRAGVDQAFERAGVRRDDVHLLKLGTVEETVSLLRYPDFDADPFPGLEASWSVNLRTGGVVARRYTQGPKTPILHRKESFLDPADPRVPALRAVTEALERRGLFRDTSRIGWRGVWDAMLREAGVEVCGTQVLERRTNPRRGALTDRARATFGRIAQAVGDILADLEEAHEATDTASAMAALSRAAGLPVLGSGEGRVVFALDEHRVLKVAKDLPTLGDECQNCLEDHRWRSASARERRWLAPVIAADPGGAWLVMERTQPAAHVPPKVLARLLAMAGDDREENVGRIENRYVLHDYGFAPGGSSASSLFARRKNPAFHGPPRE